MSIYRPEDHVEVYRIKAGSADVHEMSGRTGRPDLTAYVNRRIVQTFDPRPGETLVDVGCGDASLLRLIGTDSGFCTPHSLIGVLPTEQEVERVQSELGTAWPQLCIVQGLATATTLADGMADKVVLNGVLLLLKDEREAFECLRELFRLCKPGGKVFVGEVPDVDEFALRPYGDSISGWLWWVLRNQGAKGFLRRSRQVLRAAFESGDPLIIVPKRSFYSSQQHMRELLMKVGFVDVEVARHLEMQPTGQISPSPTRWNYIACKA